MGVHLDVSSNSLKKIETKFVAHHFYVEECLLEVLDVWRGQTDNPTCQAIIEALIKMEEKVLIDEFREIEDCIVEKGNELVDNLLF